MEVCEIKAEMHAQMQQGGQLRMMATGLMWPWRRARMLRSAYMHEQHADLLRMVLSGHRGKVKNEKV